MGTKFDELKRLAMQRPDPAEIAVPAKQRPNPIQIATWDDAFRFLDRDSIAADRHWGELPIDQELTRLVEKGWVDGAIWTPAELRHRLYEAAIQADIDYANAEFLRSDSPRVRKQHTAYVSAVGAVERDIAILTYKFGVGGHHPLMPAPPDPENSGYEDVEPTKLGLKLEEVCDGALKRLRSALPWLAAARKLSDKYAEANTTKRKRPEILRTHLVTHLVPVWRDLTGRAPGRATDAYGTGRVSPFHRYCDNALRTMHPLIEHGPLDSAIRAVIEHLKGSGRG